ncbi:protein Frey 1 isoform X1 [Balaenoptera ricei]|uniref:protein Frey 1 isoform X1 n=1 Tax=Balaenoptera ricei TaxID=2746895 RepID=UPI0028BEB402|nr:protein Frey 1 isoform X1 [Balaenoptera ricei]
MEVSSLAPALVLTRSPGMGALCEVALGVGSRFRPSAGGGAGRSLEQGPKWKMVLAMRGALSPRAALSLLLHLNLILAAALLRRQPLRPQRPVPEEFSAPLELSEPLSGLVDGSISSFPYPFPSSAPNPTWWGRDALGESTQVQPEGLLPNGICLGTSSADAKQILPPTHTLFSLLRLRGAPQAPMATRASTPSLPGPAAQAGRARHG